MAGRKKSSPNAEGVSAAGASSARRRGAPAAGASPARRRGVRGGGLPAGREEAAEVSDEERISRAKSDLSLNVIKYNHAVDDLMRRIGETMRTLKSISESFGSQRDLNARQRMSERVLNSSLKMLGGNRLQLWMIDDRTLEEDNRK